MSHVGWPNKGTALYYMKLAEVLREGSPSDLLSSNELVASPTTTLYTDLNRLKDFVSSFLISVFVRSSRFEDVQVLWFPPWYFRIIFNNRDFKIRDYRQLHARSPMSGGLDQVRNVVACCGVLWPKNSN